MEFTDMGRYKGQEQGYQGGPDPANREACVQLSLYFRLQTYSHPLLRLWLSGYIQDKPLVTHVKILNAARRAAITANSGYLTTPVRPFPHVHISLPMAYKRRAGEALCGHPLDARRVKAAYARAPH